MTAVATLRRRLAVAAADPAASSSPYVREELELARRSLDLAAGHPDPAYADALVWGAELSLRAAERVVAGGAEPPAAVVGLERPPAGTVPPSLPPRRRRR